MKQHFSFTTNMLVLEVNVYANCQVGLMLQNRKSRD